MVAIVQLILIYFVLFNFHCDYLTKNYIQYISGLNLPDECVSTKLRVAVNHVCFHLDLVTQFYTI